MKIKKISVLAILSMMLAVAILLSFAACNPSGKGIEILDEEFVRVDETTIKLSVKVKNTSSSTVTTSFSANVYKFEIAKNSPKSKSLVEKLQTPSIELKAGEEGTLVCYCRTYVGALDDNGRLYNGATFEDTYTYKIAGWNVK